MKDVYSPPRQHPHTDGEIKQFHATRDHEAAGVKDLVMSAIRTIGAPKVWTEVLAVAAPIAVDAGSGLVKALHPESPGGAKITHGELEQIANRAAGELYHALLREFAHLVVPDLQPEPFVYADGGPAPADAPPTPLVDPAELAGKVATLTAAPASTLDPGLAIPPIDPPRAA